jgi:LysM repeat protein/ABC-type branched-subunit amino acid transport system substrate-binding protein
MIRNLVLIICFVFSVWNLSAQENTPVQVINGKKYYIYKVESKNTLYSISKRFNVEQETIINENPEIKEGLKPGQELKIPVVNTTKEAEKTPVSTKENFTIHKVEQGQTLYAISKLYDVKVEDITALNPEAEQGLKPGMELKIPAKKLEKQVLPVQQTQAISKEIKNTVTHKVQKGETLYSISKQYETTQEEILKANNDLPNGLKVDDEIIIPVATSNNKPQKVQQDTIYNYVKQKLNPEAAIDDEVKVNDNEFVVALMLPFFTYENKVFEQNLKPNQKNEVIAKSLVAMQFYNGFLMAVDSMIEKGNKVKVHIYDTANDSSAIEKIFKKEEARHFDLIVGPLYANGFNVAAKFAKERKIPIVSPFVQTPSILKNNPYTNKVTPSQTVLMQETAGFVAANYASENVIVVSHNTTKDKSLLNTFVTSFRNKTSNPLKEVNYSVNGIGGISNLLHPAKKNIIVIPSNEQSIVTDIISKIYFLNKENIILVGTEGWQAFENIDMEYINKLQLHWATYSYIDFESEKVKEWINNFRSKFATEPDSYAFQANDLAWYYFTALNKNGMTYPANIQNVQWKGMAGGFEFEKTEEGGFENKSVSILKVQDYIPVKAN